MHCCKRNCIKPRFELCTVSPLDVYTSYSFSWWTHFC